MHQDQNHLPPAVLVVEDDPLVRLDIAIAMSDAGFAVLEADCADAALEMLETRSRISVVFTDIDMPGTIDGLELAHIVAQRWPHIPVLVTSGQKKPDSDEPKAFFPKPYSPAAVISTVRTLAA